MSYNPKIAVGSVLYNQYPIIIGSMITQEYQNWEMHLLHDGPPTDEWRLRMFHALRSVIPDKRITDKYTKTQQGQWGHPLRRMWLDDMRDRKDIDLVVLTNADNYHNPGFLQNLHKPFENPKVVATYSEYMSHNHNGYQTFKNGLGCSNIDISALMFRRDVASDVGWPDFSYASDWNFINSIIKKYGIENFVQVPGNFVTHN